jgi:hypothetical protein
MKKVERELKDKRLSERIKCEGEVYPTYIF